MEDLSHLSEEQRVALEKLTVLMGVDLVDHIVAQGPEVLHARFEAFMSYDLHLMVKIMTM